MFGEKEIFNVPGDKEIKPETVEFFGNKEQRDKYFSKAEERVKESMKIAEEKFSGENEEWKKIVEYIEKEAENETDTNETAASAMSMFSDLSKDCFYTLYQAIILKLQLIDERETYVVKGETEK